MFANLYLTALLQQPPQQPFWVALMPIFLIVGIFYVLVFMPQRKRQQELQRMIEALSKGDRVVTSGGVFGEVAGVDNQTVILKVADGVKIKVAKSAITGLEEKEKTS